MGAVPLDAPCPMPLPKDIAALMNSYPQQRSLVLAAALAELEDRHVKQPDLWTSALTDMTLLPPLTRPVGGRVQLSRAERILADFHNKVRPKLAREHGGEKELARYQWFEKTWQETITRLSQKFQRPEGHLAMSDERGTSTFLLARELLCCWACYETPTKPSLPLSFGWAFSAAASWRQRTEIINELEANVPLTDRLGTSELLWKMSLRDNWKLEVPLGNLFTSLYVEIEQHPPPLPEM